MGWTWEYLHHGISWAVVQRVLADLPSYDYSDKGEGKIKLKNDNVGNVSNFINGMV